MFTFKKNHRKNSSLNESKNRTQTSNFDKGESGEEVRHRYINCKNVYNLSNFGGEKIDELEENLERSNHEKALEEKKKISERGSVSMFELQMGERVNSSFNMPVTKALFDSKALMDSNQVSGTESSYTTSNTNTLLDKSEIEGLEIPLTRTKKYQKASSGKSEKLKNSRNADRREMKRNFKETPTYYQKLSSLESERVYSKNLEHSTNGNRTKRIKQPYSNFTKPNYSKMKMRNPKNRPKQKYPSMFSKVKPRANK